jgi:hypothetical protein
VTKKLPKHVRNPFLEYFYLIKILGQGCRELICKFTSIHDITNFTVDAKQLCKQCPGEADEVIVLTGNVLYTHKAVLGSPLVPA